MSVDATKIWASYDDVVARIAQYDEAIADLNEQLRRRDLTQTDREAIRRQHDLLVEILTGLHDRRRAIAESYGLPV